jgi:hypothetical protein
MIEEVDLNGAFREVVGSFQDRFHADRFDSKTFRERNRFAVHPGDDMASDRVLKESTLAVQILRVGGQPEAETQLALVMEGAPGF